jgi:hypothetical protein
VPTHAIGNDEPLVLPTTALLHALDGIDLDLPAAQDRVYTVRELTSTVPLDLRRALELRLLLDRASDPFDPSELPAKPPRTHPPMSSPWATPRACPPRRRNCTRSTTTWWCACCGTRPATSVLTAPPRRQVRPPPMLWPVAVGAPVGRAEHLASVWCTRSQRTTPAR